MHGIGNNILNWYRDLKILGTVARRWMLNCVIFGPGRFAEMGILVYICDFPHYKSTIQYHLLMLVGQEVN